MAMTIEKPSQDREASQDCKTFSTGCTLILPWFDIPPRSALYAIPTPQYELFRTAAIIPAHFSPCLKKNIIYTKVGKMLKG